MVNLWANTKVCLYCFLFNSKIYEKAYEEEIQDGKIEGGCTEPTRGAEINRGGHRGKMENGKVMG